MQKKVRGRCMLPVPFVYLCIDRFPPSGCHYSSAKKQALKEVMSKITQPSSFLLREFERQDSDKQNLMFERKNLNKRTTKKKKGLLMDDDANAIEIRDVDPWQKDDKEESHQLNSPTRVHQILQASKKDLSVITAPTLQSSYIKLNNHPKQAKQRPVSHHSTTSTQSSRSTSYSTTFSTTCPAVSSNLSATELKRQQRKIERKQRNKLKKQVRQRLYGSTSAPTLNETMKFNRDQRLIEGPSIAETIMSEMESTLGR